MSNEYLNIIDSVINNERFKKLQLEKHHKYTNRYNHSYNVALKTYKVCKKLNLDYESATKAAIVHDFFYNDEFDKKLTRLTKHYTKAIENANKIIDLSDKEKNMIASHMFPIGGKLPKSKEAIIIDICDDYVAFKEILEQNKKRIKFAHQLLMVILFSFLTK